MSIPQYFSSLSSIFREFPSFIKPNKVTTIKNISKSDFEHPFSKAQGTEIKSLRQGYARAELNTNPDGKQNNNQQFIHAAVLSTGLVSTMAAVADSSADQKESRPSIAFLKHFAQDFNKVVFPGDKLEVEAKLDGSNKNHRYIIAQIKRGSEIVGKAIADFAFLPKEKMGLTS